MSQEFFGMPCMASSGTDGSELLLATSLDQSKPENKKRLFNIMQRSTHKGSDMIGKEFQAVDLVVWDTQSVDDQTGEIKNIRRVSIILENGDSVGFASEGVLKALSSIIATFGKPTWNPPLALKAVEGKSGRGRYYALEMV